MPDVDKFVKPSADPTTKGYQLWTHAILVSLSRINTNSIGNEAVKCEAANKRQSVQTAR
jgi:hypothetical protein